LTSKLSTLGFDESQVKSIGNFISHTYSDNREFIDKFYDNLMSKNWNECLNSIKDMPPEVRDAISKKATGEFLDKIQNVLSMISSQFKIAFGHVNELMEKDPTKAHYIFALSLLAMLVAYIAGKRSVR